MYDAGFMLAMTTTKMLALMLMLRVVLVFPVDGVAIVVFGLLGVVGAVVICAVELDCCGCSWGVR